MEKTLILYSGPHCHLCGQAKAIIYPLLAEYGWRLNEIDIQSDEQLRERYGIRIPVVVLPSGEEKGWPFSKGQVARMLAASR